jgi:hypothetical protein
MRARQVSRKRPAPRQAQRAQVDEAEGGNIGLLQAALFCREKLGSVHGKSSSLQWTDCAAQGPDLSAMMEKGEYNIWYDKPTKLLWHTICRHDPQHRHSTQHTACEHTLSEPASCDLRGSAKAWCWTHLPAYQVRQADGPPRPHTHRRHHALQRGRTLRHHARHRQPRAVTSFCCRALFFH